MSTRFKFYRAAMFSNVPQKLNCPMTHITPTNEMNYIFREQALAPVDGYRTSHSKIGYLFGFSIETRQRIRPAMFFIGV
ncbi:MAG: hypothetical protein JSU88_00555 [Nitrospinaceae bacterium]|nr:MAG: hypothetical protein JSU88_00555 [Nitrospinaceae bacterium]